MHGLTRKTSRANEPIQERLGSEKSMQDGERLAFDHVESALGCRSQRAKDIRARSTDADTAAAEPVARRACKESMHSLFGGEGLRGTDGERAVICEFC